MGKPNPDRDEELPLEQPPEAFGETPRSDPAEMTGTGASPEIPPLDNRAHVLGSEFQKRPVENFSPRPLSRVPWPGDFSWATAPPAGQSENLAIPQGGV